MIADDKEQQELHALVEKIKQTSNDNEKKQYTDALEQITKGRLENLNNIIRTTGITEVLYEEQSDVQFALHLPTQQTTYASFRMNFVKQNERLAEVLAKSLSESGIFAKIATKDNLIVVIINCEEKLLWDAKACAEAAEKIKNLIAEGFYQQGQAAEPGFSPNIVVRAEKYIAYDEYRRAEKLGHIKAKTNMAYFLLMGAVQIEGSDGKKMAYQLLLDASALGHERAQLNLGTMFLDGNGIEKDLKKAREWFTQAKKGYEGQYNKAEDEAAKASAEVVKATQDGDVARVSNIRKRLEDLEKDISFAQRGIAEAERQIRRVDRLNILNQMIKPFINANQQFEFHRAAEAIQYKSFRLYLDATQERTAIAQAKAFVKSLPGDMVRVREEGKQLIVIINEEILENSAALKDIEAFTKAVEEAMQGMKSIDQREISQAPGGPKISEGSASVAPVASSPASPQRVESDAVRTLRARLATLRSGSATALAAPTAATPDVVAAANSAASAAAVASPVGKPPQGPLILSLRAVPASPASAAAMVSHSASGVDPAKNLQLKSPPNG